MKKKLPTTTGKPHKKWASALSLNPVFVWAILFLGALAIRSVYFYQASDSPIPLMQRADSTDMQFFIQWAEQIRDGDYLTKEPLHPIHDWHKAVAAHYLGNRPDIESAFKLEHPSAAEADVIRMVWNKWYGETRFHQEPLYPYLLAGLFYLFSPQWHAIALFQMGLGMLTGVLLVWVANRLFGRASGVIAGLLFIFCGPPLYLEAVVLRESLMAFFSVLLIAVGVGAVDTGKRSLLAMAGFVVGLAVLLKSTFVLFLPCLGLAYVIKHRSNWVGTLPGILLVFAGFCLPLVPAVWRNIEVNAPALSLSSVGGVTFITSNVSGYDPTAGFVVHVSHLNNILELSNGRPLSVVRETLRTHETWEYFVFLADKFKVALSGIEIPNNTNYYTARCWAPVLSLAFLDSAWVMPLGLVGLILAFWRRPYYCILPFGICVVHFLPMVLFYSLFRFRAPLLVVLLIFAAYGLTVGSALALACVRRFYTTRSNANFSWMTFSLIAGGCFFYFGSTVGVESPGKYRVVDFKMPYELYYEPRVKEAVLAGDWQTAERWVADFCSRLPEDLRGADESTPARPRSSRQRESVKFAAETYALHARILQKLGRIPEAKEALAQGKRLMVESSSR